ncbi:MAG: acyclic terpene utilization AtuA family protein [Alphaproteobacteria bacterium]
MSEKIVRIGGASGYWGESDMATPQLLKAGGIDYIVYDYLAEITMSIMARARAADPDKGYALDFVSNVLKNNLPEIARQGVKILSNAGGVNPVACGKAIEAVVAELGLDLKVAVITGDDVLEDVQAGKFGPLTEMFTGAAMPPAAKFMSANAYLGAFPIAEALKAGADIVVTGRCVDSAVTLGAAIHEFGWTVDDLDQLSGGSLAGHVIECGPQCCGGNFTDWEEIVDGIADIGYPIAEMRADGSFSITKPAGTGGKVSVGTVSEQIVYEIGDPQAYMLPDVICDFSTVSVTQDGPDRVSVAGARGHTAPSTYKVSATYADGFRGVQLMTFAGFDAKKKAEAYAAAGLKRARQKLHDMNAPDYEEVSLEIVGAESQFGDFANPDLSPREVMLKLGVKHVDQKAVGLLFKEMMGMALATPAGLAGVGGGRPKPSPVVRLFSTTLGKDRLDVKMSIAGTTQDIAVSPGAKFDAATLPRPAEPAKTPEGDTVDVPLIALAWARSGDKGDKANIGVIARDPSYFPYIANALTADVVAARFAHFSQGRVDRFVMPGMNALNFLIDEALGGGGIASLRSDPQAKTYGQILLATPVAVPAALAAKLTT